MNGESRVDISSVFVCEIGGGAGVEGRRVLGESGQRHLISKQRALGSESGGGKSRGN